MKKNIKHIKQYDITREAVYFLSISRYKSKKHRSKKVKTENDKPPNPEPPTEGNGTDQYKS